MTLEHVCYLSQTIASVAVVVSLIYAALQFRALPRRLGTLGSSLPSPICETDPAVTVILRRPGFRQWWCQGIAPWPSLAKSTVGSPA